MTKIKLTKTVVDAATIAAKEYELRDTVVPGFLLKVTPAGRKIFMVQYRTNAGERRKPALGRFGELTVEQARSIAQDWLADVRKGKDPGAEKTAARDAPSVKELCKKFIEDYSKPKNRARTVEGNQRYMDRHIISGLGNLKVRGYSVGCVGPHHSDEEHAGDRQSRSLLSAEDVQHGRDLGLPRRRH